MTHVLSTHFPPVFRNASFATYIRCHDDIGWAITEEDAEALPHISGPGHRHFLSDFYSGKFPSSFARGGIFQENEETGDRRNSGSFASLAGLEAAKESGDAAQVAAALQRILMGHALISSFGGMPLLYMGDEIGLLNDYSFSANADHAHDNRWMHRPKMDWQRANAPTGIERELLEGVKAIIARRKQTPVLAATSPTRIVRLANPALFAFARQGDGETLVCVFNFTNAWQNAAEETLREAGMRECFDHLGNGQVPIYDRMVPVAPYGRLWLR
jgi:amylosucrase